MFVVGALLERWETGGECWKNCAQSHLRAAFDCNAACSQGLAPVWHEFGVLLIIGVVMTGDGH